MINKYGVRDVMQTLENLCDNYDYRLVELGIVLFLRSDLGTLDNDIENEDLVKILKTIQYSDTLLDCGITDVVDEVLGEYENE